MDEKSLIVDIAGAAANIPAPVQATFFKTLGKLLGGLTAIPAGLLTRKAQAIEDITNARSAVAAIVAKGVAEDALADPLLMKAAAEIYLPTEMRKTRNKLQVAMLAAEELSHVQHSGKQPAEPSEDWVNAFARVAEDASSEELQQLFSRILAGEVTSPGSFSRSTLRIVSELDQSIARDFALMWEKTVGIGVNYTSDFKLGDWYLRWKKLAECGLMAGEPSARFTPDVDPGRAGFWMPISFKGVTLSVTFRPSDTHSWSYIGFTQVGRELGSVLPLPDVMANVREVGKSLAQLEHVKVILNSPLHGPEPL